MTMDKNRIHELTGEAVGLLKGMVAIPSPSFSEDKVCTYICNWLTDKGITYKRDGNNIIAALSCMKKPDDQPALMLCAHIDTVAPCDGYSFDPYRPDHDTAAEAIAGRIESGDADFVAGLGSNDDGASVVSMIAAFRYFHDRFLDSSFRLTRNGNTLAHSPDSCDPTVMSSEADTSVNLIMVLSCEEERICELETGLHEIERPAIDMEEYLLMKFKAELGYCQKARIKTGLGAVKEIVGIIGNIDDAIENYEMSERLTFTMKS